MDPRVAHQLERLYRHYMGARSTGDLIAFYDLTHTLRVWTEIAVDEGALGDFYAARKFRCARPAKKNKKTLNRNDCEYIWFYTAHHNHAEIIQPMIYMPKDMEFKGDQCSAASEIYTRPNDLVGLRGYYLGTVVDGFKPGKFDFSDKLTLAQFLGGEILSVRHGEIDERYCSHFLIKQAANQLMDASHFNPSNETDNPRLEGVIALLCYTSIGSLSVFSFFILYLAQEILIAFGRIQRIDTKVKRTSSVKY